MEGRTYVQTFQTPSNVI